MRVNQNMDLPAACKALESTLLRQLLSASGAFKGGSAAGAEMHGQMFVDALADAVAKGDGLGIAKMLQRTLGKGEADGSDGEDAAVGPAERPHASTAAHLGALPPTSPTPPDGGPGLPVGMRMTSGYGPRADPLEGDHRFHTGVDFAAPEGAPIRAVAPGTVRSAGPRGGYGNAIEIDHGGGVTTLYGHASALTVTPGQHVGAGDEVGLVGHTGRATGPHLHFEVRQGGQPVDPLAGARRALNAYGNRVDNKSEAKPGTTTQSPSAAEESP
jgi:murein DD-endopeptidase MepM/ murein hydrolase activator NlpD